MRPPPMSRSLMPALLAGVCFSAIGCGSASDSGPAGSGGAPAASGGSPGVGTGGATAGSGGSPGSGGAQSTSSGGNSSSGGSSGTGGAGTGGLVGSGGSSNPGTGGGAATGGRNGTGGRAATGGAGAGGAAGRAGGTGGTAIGGTGGTAVGGTGGAGGAGARFSFFVTSIEAMRALSGSQDGFGGDLRFAEATGLAGADKICTEVAKRGMPGAEAKTWRAFLSATTGGANGGAVNAIDRVGNGPWYDRMGRLVAMTKTALAMQRPMGADLAIRDDLPNEMGIPNHQGVDNHDTLTGSTTGMLMAGATAASTCNDWTSAVGTTGKPMLGHSWPAGSGMNWMQAHAAGGCAPGVNLMQSGGPGDAVTVGAGGGYGGIYCFALTP